MATPQKLRVGVIGTGAFAEVCHIPGLLSHPDAEVVAVWGRRLEAARVLADSFGIRRALVTDVARDGAMLGPGLEALAQVAALGFQVQASGGLRDLADLALCAGVPGTVAAISGKALLDGVLTPEDPAVRAAMAAPEGAL